MDFARNIVKKIDVENHRNGVNHLGISKRNRLAWLFLTPFIVCFLLFSLYPILYSLYLSFQDMDALSGNTRFVGLENYARLFSSGFFFESVKNTLVIWLMSIIPQLTLAFLLSLMLSSKWLRGRAILRNVYFFPNLVTPVTIGLLFGSLFQYPGGAVNQAINLLGLEAVNFQNNPFLAQMVIAIAICWKNFGYNIVFFMAALNSISPEVYEAADVDGAGYWQRTFRITIPLMRPMLIYVMVTSIIGGLQIFDESKLVFKTTPGNAATTMVKYMYDAAFDRLQFGYGAAVSFGIFLIIVVFSCISLLVTRRREAD